LLDRDTAALIDQPAFEPRITQRRQRIAHVEAQRQQLAEPEALHTDLRLMSGRLEDFAAQVRTGLAEADWSRQRELIRALVKRVGVAHDQVPVVFRIDPRPGDPSPEKKSLQHCRRSHHAPWRRSAPCRVDAPVLQVSRRAEGGAHPAEAVVVEALAQARPQDRVGQAVAALRALPRNTPRDASPGLGARRQGGMAAAARAQALRVRVTLRLVVRLQEEADPCVPQRSRPGGQAQRAERSRLFGAVGPPPWGPSVPRMTPGVDERRELGPCARDHTLNCLQ